MDPHDAGGGQHAELTQKVALLPDQPGVYLFRGPDNEALYIGKAQSLRRIISRGCIGSPSTTDS
jgi:excinuclease UvrABC nuclease subunit